MTNPYYPIESLSRDPDDDMFFSDNRSSLETTRNVGKSNRLNNPGPMRSESLGRSGRPSDNSLSDTFNPVRETDNNGDGQKGVALSDRLSAFQNKNTKMDASPNSTLRTAENRDVAAANVRSGGNSGGSGLSEGASLLGGPNGSVPPNGSNKSDFLSKYSSNGSGSGGPPNRPGSGGPPNGSGPTGGKGKKAKNKKLVILKRTLLVFLIVFLVGCLGVGSFIFAAVRGTPKYDPEKIDNLKFASTVYDKDGNQIAQLSSTENRLAFKYEDLPELLIDSLIAVEDKHFEDHLGFDPLRIVKGAFNTIFNPDKPEGGSTLTTQLAKNTFIENKTSRGMEGVQRKIQEIVLAMQIEHDYTKQEILTTYLTQTYFGHGAFGVRSAAQVYFGKEPIDLTIPEIALICGLPQAPNSYDPYQYPEKAKNRRTIVLSVMRDSGLITAEDYEQYKEEPFTFVDAVNNGTETIKMGSGSETKYPYFVDYLVSCLLDENQYNLDQNQVYGGGLKIYTTVDPKIQEEAESVISDPANFPANAKDGTQVQGAIVMLENTTGNVVAMAGGREYPENQQRCFNRASSAKRQPGSCAKPVIVYAPALEKGGFFAGTVLDDCPTTYGSWSPKNSSGGHSGLITMREAIRNSVNIYAIKLYEEAGMDYCFDFAKNKLALELNDASSSNRSNALGAFSATPLEIARAYSAFPNKGILKETNCVTKITDNNDKVILEPEGNETRAMKESTAYIMCDLMRTVVTNGTGTKAAIGNWYICGKTGTTDSSQYSGSPDAWFTGYNAYYTAAVWIGFDSSDKDHHLVGEYGGNKPAGMWKKVMTKALEGKTVQSGTIFPRPNEVIDIKFDLMSGLSPGPLTPTDLIRSEIGTSAGVPSRQSDVWTELTVDRINPSYLAPPGYPFGETRVFLNLPNRQWWADKELPYKPPTEYSNGFFDFGNQGGGIGGSDNSDGSGGSGNSDNTSNNNNHNHNHNPWDDWP